MVDSSGNTVTTVAVPVDNSAFDLQVVNAPQFVCVQATSTLGHNVKDVAPDQCGPNTFMQLNSGGSGSGGFFG